MTEVVFYDLSKGDAKKLRSWWDANTPWYHFVKKQTAMYKSRHYRKYNKFYMLIRQL